MRLAETSITRLRKDVGAKRPATGIANRERSSEEDSAGRQFGGGAYHVWQHVPAFQRLTPRRGILDRTSVQNHWQFLLRVLQQKVSKIY